MPKTIPPPDYEPQAVGRTVGTGAQISCRETRLRCLQAIAGKRVALRATNTGDLFDLCYRRHVPAQVDLRQHIVKTVHHVPEQASTLNPV